MKYLEILHIFKSKQKFKKNSEFLFLRFRSEMVYGVLKTENTNLSEPELGLGHNRDMLLRLGHPGLIII